jgi:hypothetical protein
MLRTTFAMLRKRFSHVANRRLCNIQREMLGSMLRVCLWYVASSRRATFGVSENNQGAHELSSSPVVALAGGEGWAPKPSIREWVWHISSRGSSAPHLMEPFSARPGAIVGRVVGRKSSNPVMMSITARPGSSSGFHGGTTTTASDSTGPVLPTSSAGQVGSATSPHTPPFNVAARKFLRCWWARIPMYCVMLEFWRLLLVVLDPFAATFDVV